MTKSYQKFDDDFKKMIVQLVESGRRKSEVAREYGISEPNIRVWVSKFGNSPKKNEKLLINLL